MKTFSIQPRKKHMDKPNNYDPSSWFNDWSKYNKRVPKHRLSEYLKDDEMQFSENFDEFFKKAKENMSNEDWDRFMKNMQKKAAKGPAPSGMVIMFEDDYENLIEMRGLFKNTNRPEYVETINKIIGTVKPSEGM
jgi:hypothetical protein